MKTYLKYHIGDGKEFYFFQDPWKNKWQQHFLDYNGGQHVQGIPQPPKNQNYVTLFDESREYVVSSQPRKPHGNSNWCHEKAERNLQANELHGLPVTSHPQWKMWI